MAAAAFLFDLDGTLWDSLPWYARMFHSAVGVDPQAVVAALRGHQTIVALSRRYGISHHRWAGMVGTAARELMLYPGVDKVLHELADHRIAMGMVTNLPAWVAKPVLEAKSLDRLLPVQVYAAAKPSPAGLLRALESMGRRSPRRVYYVGDSDRDAEASRRAGIQFVWAAYGYGESLNRENTASLKEFSDILTFLKP